MQSCASHKFELLEVGPYAHCVWEVEYPDVAMSRHNNMKELRVSKGGALRVLFAFDPRRHAILLLGGDKSGRWSEWYRWAVPAADDLYDTHLGELRDEGLLNGD